MNSADKNIILSDINEIETRIENLYNTTVYYLDTEIDRLIDEVQSLYEQIENLEVEE